MPEGPEVRVVADGLHRLLRGQTLLDLDWMSGVYTTNGKPAYRDTRLAVSRLSRRCATESIRIDWVHCKGKYIYAQLTRVEAPTSHLYLFFHLAMTGLFLREATPHSRLRITYGDSSSPGEIYFTDQRNFGRVYLCDGETATARLQELGPDVMSRAFTPAVWNSILAEPRYASIPIGALLLRQGVISGIGNYLRSDVLYRAGLYPWRQVRQIRSQEAADLYHQIVTVCLASYKAGGTTISNYRNQDGEMGRYSPIIYGRSIDPLGNPVLTHELEGRTMHWVPAVQSAAAQARRPPTQSPP